MISQNATPPDIPLALERSEVPRYFRQFQNAAVLKKLAHSGKGPLYQVIGRKAWYETADIIAWLEARKQSGPEPSKTHLSKPEITRQPIPKIPPRRRGRPTKVEQFRRMSAQQAETSG